MNRRLILLSVLCLAIVPAWGNPFRVPTGLEDLGYSAVYSINQEESGAIWLHTGRGVYRFNGHDAEFRQGPLSWNRLETKDGSHFYSVLSNNALLNFPVSSIRVDTLRLGGNGGPDPVLLDEGDSLLVGSSDRILTFSHGDLVSERVMLPGCRITALLRTREGVLLVGTESDGILIQDPEQGDRIFPASSSVRALYQDARGLIWAGLREGGFFAIRPSVWQTVDAYENCEGKALIDCRSFCEDREGKLYLGTARGLVILSRDGQLREERLGGALGRPVCTVFCDRDGNLWVGTYYNGVFFSGADSFPLKPVPFNPEALIIKGLAEDSERRVWVLTDGYGMYCYDMDSAKTTLIPGSKGVKFQCAFFDAVSRQLFAGVYRGYLWSMDVSTGLVRQYRIPAGIPGREETIQVIYRKGDELILGGLYGLYLFQPEAETAVTRKIDGIGDAIYDLATGPDDKLYIAGQGVYVMDSLARVEPLPLPEDRYQWVRDASCYDLVFDERGRLWMAFARRGVACLEPGRFIRYNHSTCGIADDFTSRVIPCQDGYFLIVTNSGITIIHPDKSECFNYDKSNGLNFGSARGCTSLVLSDGTAWIGGNDGIESIPTAFPAIRAEAASVVLDKIFVNGKRYDTDPTLPFRQELCLDHTQNNFSFDIASFDYPKAAYTAYRHKLEGYDKDWVPFRPETPVSYMNMKPGKYTFRAQALQRNGEDLAEAFVTIRIRPPWHATVLARILFVLLAAALLYLILHSINSRIILTEKLKLKERENADKTRFFVNLSYQLRTPVNLIIGQMEKFFRDFGSRTAGIEDLEDIYGKAKQMRSLISDYVDIQNEAPTEADGTLLQAYKNAKFLNAAIGTVERNLYSKDLNVSTLCAELNVGKTTLTERLKEASGLTPREFIEDIRLKHAALMLQDGVYRVAEVADNLAFSSPKYFAQRFKLKYGVTPRDYKGRKTDLSQQ